MRASRPPNRRSTPHKQHGGVAVGKGALLNDGDVVPAELLVLGTGYKNQQETVRLSLGDAIAEKIGPVWGFDEDGEFRGMW